MNTKMVPISELAEVNPKTDLHGLKSDSLVSFIPMADVTESGYWVGRQVRPLCDVRVGYTAFAEDDVLFAKITPCMENGKGAHVKGLVNGLGFGSTEFHVLRTKGDNDPRYIFHWLQTKQTRLRAIAYMGGSAGQQRVQKDFFVNYRVPEIAPAEQSGIAYILDAIDEAIAQTEAVIAKLKKVRAGMLHDLLNCGLDEHGQLRDPIAHPEQFKDSPLGLIPKEWEVCTLAELAIEKLVNGVFKEPKRVGSGVPLVNVADLYKGESVDLEACELFSVTKDEITRYGVLRGDIFFTRSSLKLEGIAQTSFMFTDAGDAVFECHVMRLRPDTKKIVPRFLKEWCAGDFARRHFMAHAKQVTMTTISQDGVSRLLCPRPDLTEQEKAVSIIEAMADSLLNEITIAQKLRFLKIALQDDLLTGRVRVPETIMEGAERE